ncbi:MAG TPA: FAD-dependent oxidoreductase [Longimicrobiales bacterium]
MGNAGGAGGPDLREGVALSEIPEGGILAGHVGEESVLLYRYEDEVSAVGGTCTHYSGPLGEGVVEGDRVVCPWHHACFSLRTGEALKGPALNPLPRWTVVWEGERVRVTEKHEPAPYAPRKTAPAGAPARLVIVGFGAAGASAVEWLLRQGWGGRIEVVEPDPDAPYDRPNLSKDYLAGTAQEEWIPLRPAGWYEEHGVVVHRTSARALDTARQFVTLEDGAELAYDALLLATGASPVRIPLPGEGPAVLYLRSLADSRGIIRAAAGKRRAVVIGASFIGLEVAASLRTRGLEVDVVAPEEVPFERVLGRELGETIRALHEEHGVRFHLGHTATRLEDGAVELDDGARLEAELVVVGVGVRPVLDLAQSAGLAIERGVLVDERLRSSAPGVWAAGDIARYPDAATGERIRVEHWVVAQRQGAAAAADMIGRGAEYRDVPFFWSQHYDLPINYVGHAEGWDEAAVDGDPSGRDVAVAYRRGGRTLAVATIYRDRESIEAEQKLASARR